MSCKEKPTYNPFDNQFNIDESYFAKDKLDTIWDTCGYYTLLKKEDDLNIQYGYFGDVLQGKGFNIDIDTTKFLKEFPFEIWIL